MPWEGLGRPQHTHSHTLTSAHTPTHTHTHPHTLTPAHTLSHPLSLPPKASDGRDALAKDIYDRLFQWLVAAINESTAARALERDRTYRDSERIIALLDIFGFESFQVSIFFSFTKKKTPPAPPGCALSAEHDVSLHIPYLICSLYI